jgi:hypothetical protein
MVFLGAVCALAVETMAPINKPRDTGWSLGNLWMLPFVRTKSPLKCNSSPGLLMAQNFDYGIFTLKIKCLSSSFVSMALLRATTKAFLKIVSLIFIWGLVNFLYYLCSTLTYYIIVKINTLINIFK